MGTTTGVSTVGTEKRYSKNFIEIAEAEGYSYDSGKGGCFLTHP